MLATHFERSPSRGEAVSALFAAESGIYGRFGYVLFRRAERWDAGRATEAVRARELCAVDARAARRLWTFLLDLDLMATVEAARLPVDDAVLTLLVDQRQVRPRVSDNIGLRLLDVPAARRYAAPLDVVLDVTNDLLPANAGRWRLRTAAAGGAEVAADGYPAEVVRTSEPADLAVDVRDLAAAYLGRC